MNSTNNNNNIDQPYGNGNFKGTTPARNLTRENKKKNTNFQEE